MAYTEPVDPTPGTPIRAIDMITYAFENIRYLFRGRPVDSLLYTQAGDMTYTANTFGNYNAALTKSLTINSGRVRVTCSFKPKLYFSGAGTQWGYFDLAMDGTRYGHASLGLANIANPNANGSGDLVTLEALFMNVPAGLRTFTLQAKYIAGTATSGGITIVGTANAECAPVNMIVQEV